MARIASEVAQIERYGWSHSRSYYVLCAVHWPSGSMKKDRPNWSKPGWAIPAPRLARKTTSRPMPAITLKK